MAIPTIEQIEESGKNMDTVTEEVKSSDHTLVDQYGDTRQTMTGRENTFNTQIADQNDTFQNRFALSDTPIPWSAGLLIEDELQLYSTGTKGESGYLVWLADPNLLPFTTSATFAEDDALNRWAVSLTATYEFVEDYVSENSTNELEAIALALNTPVTTVMYATVGDVVGVDIKYVHDVDQEKTFSVPTDAIGKTIASVVGDILNTTVGGPYKLTHASGKVQPTGAPSLIAMADQFALVYNPLHWGAPTDGTDAQPEIQAMFDSIEEYQKIHPTTGEQEQNSAAFQTPVEVYIGKEFCVASPIVKKFRNNMAIKGVGKLKALAGFIGGDYLLELIACSHCDIDGIFFDGGSYACKSALRLSGTGIPPYNSSDKRNSTNIKVSKCFFHQFGATGDNGYVVDTLSPNGVPGDYSIDDSEFLGCNWLGSFGGALRLASSEIKLDGGKMSFISQDGILPNISLGNGSSIMITDLVFTGKIAALSQTSPLIKADTGASIGRIKIDGCYVESSNAPLYQQAGGTCRILDIQGGYYAGLDDSESTFVLFSSACKGQLSMLGVTFQTNGYKFIDLGDSGSYIGDAQTSTTSFKSYYPQIKNGAFSERKFAIQTTQDGDKKRIIDAKYEQLNDTKLQLFVGTEDDFTRLRFLTLKDALRYVDQSGYTECEVQVFTGTHVIDEPFTFAGDLTIQGDGAATSIIDIQSNITVRNGRFAIASAEVNYIDKAIRNKGSFVSIIGCILTAADDSTYLIDHYNGDTILSSCVFKVAGSGVSINNNYRSTGTINYYATSFTNTNARAADGSTAMCRVMYNATGTPSAGYWPRGSIAEASAVNSGAVMQYTCTVAGSPGTWRATVTAA